MFPRFVKINLFKLILLFIIFNFKAFAIDTNIPKTDEEWLKAFNSLNWKNGPLVFSYNEANSKINISDSFSILEGEEAHQMLYWLNGTTFNYIDMYAMNNNDRSQYMFFYSDTGYVKTDDWTDVDPNK